MLSSSRNAGVKVEVGGHRQLAGAAADYRVGVGQPGDEVGAGQSLHAGQGAERSGADVGAVAGQRGAGGGFVAPGVRPGPPAGVRRPQVFCG